MDFDIGKEYTLRSSQRRFIVLGVYCDGTVKLRFLDEPPHRTHELPREQLSQEVVAAAAPAATPDDFPHFDPAAFPFIVNAKVSERLWFDYALRSYRNWLGLLPMSDD